MTRYYYRPWKDETLVSALHFLRCRIVREGEGGLTHVDALLRQLGVNPQTLPMPKKTPKHFRRGEVRQLVLYILRNGPLTGSQISEQLVADLDQQAKYKRVYAALNSLKKAGLVENSDRKWKSTISSSSNFRTKLL